MVDVLQTTITIGSLCLAAGFLLLFIVYRRRERRTMECLNDMLDAAIAGTFTEKEYDETYRSALEMRMAQYLKKSEGILKNVKLDQDKINTLISDISHQTKTPIANISLYTELLLEKELEGEVKNCVGQIQGQTEKLQFLISALIETSRLENGIIRLEPVKGNVDRMIRDAAAQAGKKAQIRGITIETSTDEVSVNVFHRKMSGEVEKQKHCAVFDEKWTREALYNLLDNAVKYTIPGDTIEIHVTSYELFLRIDVTDHGPGIPEAEQAKIFGRFYRGENARNAEGVGIGLYLANQIVNGEGGYLKVKSKDFGETTFSMFLPRTER